MNRDPEARATIDALAGCLDVQALEVLTHVADRLADFPAPDGASPIERRRHAIAQVRTLLVVLT